MVFQINGNSYLHTAYSNASDGSVDFSITENDDATYIGQYNSSSADESTNPDDYIWSEVDENADQEYPIDDTEETEEYDDELVDQFDRSDADSTLATGGAQVTGDAKIQTYHQDEEPNPDEYVFTVGDLWYDTNDGNHLYRWDGTAWVDAQDEKINSKTASYYQATAPTGGTYSVNDAWYDTSNGNKMYSWNGTAWIPQLFQAKAIDVNSLFADVISTQSFNMEVIKNETGYIGIQANYEDPEDPESSSANEIVLTATTYASVTEDVKYSQITLDQSGDLTLHCTGNMQIISENNEITVPGNGQQTYTSFDGGVLSGGSIVVVKKIGWCQVFGYLKPSAAVTNFTQVLDSEKVPAPEHGANITPTVPSWYSASDDPARVRVQATGGLAIQGGTANREYNFSITYPV
mgnify:CR=1 FL=1